MAWNQLWDRDNLKLTYELTRDNTVISKRAAPVPFWERSTMSFIDADSESSHSSTAATYRVTASAPDGTLWFRLPSGCGQSANPSKGGLGFRICGTRAPLCSTCVNRQTLNQPLANAA